MARSVLLLGLSKFLYRSDDALHPEAKADTAARVSDNDDTVSSMTSRAGKIDEGSTGRTRPEPNAEGFDKRHQALQRQLKEAEHKYQEQANENQQQKKIIAHLQNQMRHASNQHQNLEKDHWGLKRAYSDLKGVHSELENSCSDLERGYSKLEQEHDDLTSKHKSMVRKYEDLDKKYMDIARTLQVTGDDPSTINKKLEAVFSSIENMVRRGKGKASVNLNKDVAIQQFRTWRLLEKFPVQESDLESFHLNLLMESFMMSILNEYFFSRPLQSIFDRSHEFEVVCEWMKGRGSRAGDRWRQELCILIGQGGEKFAHSRREMEVANASADLEGLFSLVYENVDVSMVSKISELCNMAYDLNFAMFGMESRVYPAWPFLGAPFDDEHMTMSTRSDPGSPVSLVVFPLFKDNDNRYYSKAKVWCPRGRESAS